MEIADFQPDGPSKRKRGRPAGAKNKFSRDARALLAQRGPAAVGVLLSVATGRAVWGASERGKKQRLVPDLEQQLSAAKWVGERLLPALRSSEVTSVNTNLNAEAEPADIHQLAKVMAAVLHRAVEEGAPEDSATAQPASQASVEAWPAVYPPWPVEAAQRVPEAIPAPASPAEPAAVVVDLVRKAVERAEQERAEQRSAKIRELYPEGIKR